MNLILSAQLKYMLNLGNTLIAVEYEAKRALSVSYNYLSVRMLLNRAPGIYNVLNRWAHVRFSVL
jgi:hypothetical protein